MADFVGKVGLAVAAFAAGALPCACDRGGPAAAPTSHANADKTVATSFYPTTYFAERIGGGAVRVVCPCPKDEDPVFWRPSREALAEYQAASLVVLNGAAYERWADAAALPPSRVVDSTAGLGGELLKFPGITHNHGAGGAHSHEGTDGHTWMDPRIAAAQAGAIRDAMLRTWPAEAERFEDGYEALRTDLMKLDQRLAGLDRPAKAAALFASHPAYGYLARRYGWTVVNIDVPPDEEPTADQWTAVGAAMAKAGAGPKVVLFEAEPTPATRDRLLKQWGAASAVFDPCETPGDGTYLERMNGNLDRLEWALGVR